MKTKSYINPVLALTVICLALFAASCVVKPAPSVVVVKPRPKVVVVQKPAVIVVKPGPVRYHRHWRRRHC